MVQILIRSLLAALVVTVFHISCTLSQTSYDSCIASAQAALQLVHYNGTSWPSCSDGAVPRCVQTAVFGNGNSTYYQLVQCVVYNQVIGCGINGAPPCGAYSGPTGTYGIQVYQGNGLTSINTTVIQAVLNNFYPQIGYDNSVSLCCGPVTCRLVSVQSINIDVCETGEYMLKCAGDSLHGICNVWNSAETGEYLLINVDPSVATSTTSSSASASSSASTSFSASTPSSTGQTSSRHAPVPIIVGVTIVGVIVSLTVVYLLYRYRKNAALSSAAGQASPRPQAPNGAGEAFQVPTVGLSSVVGPESIQSQYCAPPVIDQSHLLPWSVNLPLASQIPSGESTHPVLVSTNPKEIYNPYEGLAPRSGGVTSPSGSAPIPVQALVSEMAQMREEIDTLQQAIRERDNLPPAYDDA